MESNENKRRSVGGIWERTSKSNEKYFSIQIEFEGQKYNFVAFTNNFSTEHANAPDYRIYAAQKPTSPSNTPTKKSEAPAAKTARQPERTPKRAASKPIILAEGVDEVEIEDTNF